MKEDLNAVKVKDEVDQLKDYVLKHKKFPKNVLISDLFELKSRTKEDDSFPYFLQFTMEKKRTKLGQ